jgi:hypothetical protein
MASGKGAPQADGRLRQDLIADILETLYVEPASLAWRYGLNSFHRSRTAFPLQEHHFLESAASGAISLPSAST